MDPDLAFIRGATGASVVERGARIQSLWRGYGELYRVRIDGRSAVVKSIRAPRGDDDVSHARKLRSYEVELEFYRRYTPAARTARFIAGREGLLVLEDLDAAGFGGRRGDLAPCVDWLARFHAQYVGVAPTGLWATGTYWHLGTRRDELANIADAAIRDAAPILDQRLRSARYQTIVHGDAKLANFCFGESGVAAVDFQYVGGGVGVCDVAYLLSGEPNEEELLDRYFAQLGDADVEREWRALYPIASADFYRFIAGWAKNHFDTDAHARLVMRRVLAKL